MLTRRTGLAKEESEGGEQVIKWTSELHQEEYTGRTDSML